MQLNRLLLQNCNHTRQLVRTSYTQLFFTVADYIDFLLIRATRTEISEQEKTIRNRAKTALYASATVSRRRCVKLWHRLFSPGFVSFFRVLTFLSGNEVLNTIKIRTITPSYKPENKLIVFVEGMYAESGPS